MLFGHNTNVKIGESVFHVQTEDRGSSHALIDTTVYCRGRVLHRRTNNYLDLLPLDPQRENLLRKRIDDQHGGVIEEIRSGALKLVPPPPPAQPNSPQNKTNSVPASRPAPAAPSLHLELVNAKSWLQGKRANLHVAVRTKENGGAISGAVVKARIEGASEAKEFSTKTGNDGQAKLQFEMPRVTAAESALVIEATHAGATGHMKFHLRARPRVPTA
jgi:hypothetical protein